MTLRSLVAPSLLLALVYGVPSVASAQIPDDAVPLQTVISETNRFRTEYAEYYNNKDVTRLTAMYDAGAIVTVEGGTTLVGRAAIQEYMTKGAATFPHLVIKSDSLIAFGPTAIDEGTTTRHPAAGGELTSKYLVVLRRHMGVWTIIRLSVVPVEK